MSYFVLQLTFMSKRTQHSNLKSAKSAKKDEFYTQLTDIAKELKHYKDHFKNKVVYCNCDDPRVSNFFHYFSFNYEKLGLKKLVATCYKNQNMELFSEHNSDKAIYLEYKGDKNKNNIPDKNEIGIKKLKGDGDFRSSESVELLKKADIIVTNPPFSLFREFVAQLEKHDKKFIIIGNVNAITYKEIFRLIKQNKLWLGASIHSGDREFGVPDDYPLTAAGYRVDENGKKFVRVKGVRWFTNLDYKERHDQFIPYKNYTPQEYPKYENFDAINVDKTNDIPGDYKGYMGVPITFLDKYNPDQFEIVALGIVGSIEFSSNRKMEILDKKGQPTGKFTFNAKGTLYRLFDPSKDKTPSFRDIENKKLYTSIYARVIIKNKLL